MKELTSFFPVRKIRALLLVCGLCLLWTARGQAAPGNLRSTIDLGGASSTAIAALFDASGRFVFVLDQAGEQISVLDRWRYSVRNTFNLLTGCTPADLEIADTRLYVTCTGLDRVDVLDISSVTGDSPVISRVVVSGIVVGDAPGALAYDAASDRVLVNNRGTLKNVSVIDNSLATPAKLIDVTVCSGNDPNGIAVASNGNAYVSCTNATVDIIQNVGATPSLLGTISGSPMSGFIPQEIRQLAGTYLYVAYTNLPGTETGFVVVNSATNTFCAERQSVGSGAVSMTAFTDTDNSPAPMLGFLTENGATYTMEYVDITAIEAGACPPAGPPSRQTQSLTIPSEKPSSIGRRRIAYSESLLIVPAMRPYVYTVSSAPYFQNDTTALPFLTYNNLIGTDPLVDPGGIDGDQPFISINVPFTLLPNSNFDPGSLVVSLYPDGTPLGLASAATADGGIIVIEPSDLANLTDSQVVEVRLEGDSGTSENTVQLIRVARLDLTRPSVPQAPTAFSTGDFISVEWPASSDPCPLDPPADCSALESGDGDVVSGVAEYIVRAQSQSNPSVVFLKSVSAGSENTEIDISSAGLGLTETWLVAVAARDAAGNRSSTYSSQSPSTPLRVGSYALFGEDGGFGCTAGNTGHPLFLLLLVIAGSWVIRRRTFLPGERG